MSDGWERLRQGFCPRCGENGLHFVGGNSIDSDGYYECEVPRALPENLADLPVLDPEILEQFDRLRYTLRAGKQEIPVVVLGPDPECPGWVFVRFLSGARHEARVSTKWLTRGGE